MSNIRITTLPFCCAVELAWHAHPNNSLQERLRRCLCCLATRKCAMKTKVSNRLLLLAGTFILSVGAAVIAPPPQWRQRTILTSKTIAQQIMVQVGLRRFWCRTTLMVGAVGLGGTFFIMTLMLTCVTHVCSSMEFTLAHTS